MILENSVNLGNRKKEVKLMLRTLIEKNVGVKQLKQIFWMDLIKEIGFKSET